MSETRNFDYHQLKSVVLLVLVHFTFEVIAFEYQTLCLMLEKGWANVVRS